MRLLSKCDYCKRPLTETRNIKYCCVECRQKGSRKIPSNGTLSILGSSYFQHIEKTIKRNPFKLGSITSLEDILDYYHLYIRKARHQRSYAIPAYEGYQGTLKPVGLLFLEVCHQLPNSKGGANTSANMIIAPKFINNQINDAIPYQYGNYPGIKSTRECIPFSGSLFDGLVEQYGLPAVTAQLSKITPAKRFYGTVVRDIKFNGIDNELPLSTLLHEELWRLGHKRIAECLENSRKMFSYYPLYLELLAIVCFYTVLTGDADDVIGFICRLFHRCFAKTVSNSHQRYTELIYLLLSRYLYKYFSVKVVDRDAVVRFYNSLYSKEIIAPGETENEVLCYRYRSGSRCSKTTVFFPSSWKKDNPDDL
ncbi:hypothetical protein EL44_10970 [Salmonella enterica]|uniref:Uncharacterized protein n=1 Tax=Salmonella enterica TaxID=28901 RepID=A0A5U2D177_SALER|nr:hypothetical protein [Salmonella enterica subsp. enterica serovar Vitkin]EBO9827692.1 hypothetical protein [Salmonella enterica]ECV8945145.1 hypothetical protein [Salmonella enterica subsp. enterica serovar Enteritidis]EDR5776366.1 hypothetical protein [Salmonella enterica subsp. enterica serovar Kokomlemle]EBP0030456.1 hypothetical protein [Salmonella enterica]